MNWSINLHVKLTELKLNPTLIQYDYGHTACEDSPPSLPTQSMITHTPLGSERILYSSSGLYNRGVDQTHFHECTLGIKYEQVGVSIELGYN